MCWGEEPGPPLDGHTVLAPPAPPISHLLLPRKRLERAPRPVSKHDLHHFQLQQASVDGILVVRPPVLGQSHPPLVEAVRQRGQDAHRGPHAHPEDPGDHGGNPLASLRGEGAESEYKSSAIDGAQQLPPSSREPVGGHIHPPKLRPLRLPAVKGTPSGSVGEEAEVGAAMTPREFYPGSELASPAADWEGERGAQLLILRPLGNLKLVFQVRSPALLTGQEPAQSSWAAVTPLTQITELHFFISKLPPTFSSTRGPAPSGPAQRSTGKRVPR